MDYDDEVVELRFQLKESRDKELIYLSVLQDIDSSLFNLFRRETENKRFSLEEDINFRECCENLKNYLNECKRIYKIKLWNNN